MIYAGQGVHWAEAYAELKRLAELLAAPVCTSLEGKSAFDETHPLALGSGGAAIPKPVRHFLDAADAEDHVGGVQEVAHGLGDRRPARTQGQGMGLVEGALALQAGADRRGQELGQALQLAIGLGPVHALAGVDHRPLGLDQDLGRRLDRLGIGGEAGAQHRLIDQGLGDLLVHDVPGDLDQRRARAAIPELGEGAAQDVGGLGRQVDRLGELGDAGHLDGGVVVVGHMGEAARITLGQHQHRHGLRIGLGDAAIGVLGARPVLHGEDAHLFAAGHARIGVGHVQAGALLTDDDGADVGLGRRLEDCVARIAEQHIHAFALQDLRNRRRHLHSVRLHA